MASPVTLLCLFACTCCLKQITVKETVSRCILILWWPLLFLFDHMVDIFGVKIKHCTWFVAYLVSHWEQECAFYVTTHKKRRPIWSWFLLSWPRPRLLTPISAARWRTPSINIGFNYLRYFSTSVNIVSKCYLNVLLETVIDILFYVMVNQWIVTTWLLFETKQQQIVLWWWSNEFGVAMFLPAWMTCMLVSVPVYDYYHLPYFYGI